MTMYLLLIPWRCSTTPTLCRSSLRSTGWLPALIAYMLVSIVSFASMIINVCRNVVAPLLVRPHRLFSNFWGAIASNGFYSRSHDYQEILKGERKYAMHIHTHTCTCPAYNTITSLSLSLSPSLSPSLSVSLHVPC